MAAHNIFLLWQWRIEANLNNNLSFVKNITLYICKNEKMESSVKL